MFVQRECRSFLAYIRTSTSFYYSETSLQVFQIEILIFSFSQHLQAFLSLRIRVKKKPLQKIQFSI